MQHRDGNSYEREAILAWLERNNISPITRNPMQAGDLVPNRSLRSSIEDYLYSAVHVSIDRHKEVESKSTEANDDVEVANFNAPEVTLLGRASDTDAGHIYMVSVTAEHTSSLQRHPATIVCVVDTSGSMCSAASVQGVESAGLSMLDIVKHAVRTVITTLGDNDRFGLVTFATRGNVVFDLIHMTPPGKALALSKVNDLKSGGSTNLWEGLKCGMDMLGVASDLSGNSAIFLLTDGVPSEIPPRGHIPMMQRYRDSNGGRYPAIINTFGFGYALDSDLLSDMAIEGGGMYAFIPDSGFVGTAFVNALGNHLSSYGKQCVLSVEIESGAVIDEDNVLGNPDHSGSSWGIAFKIPNLLAGTSQNFFFKVIEPQAGVTTRLQVSLTYEHLVSSGANRGIVTKENRTIDMPAENSLAIIDDSSGTAEDVLRSLWYEAHHLRLSLVDVLDTICHELKTFEPNTPKPAHTDKLRSLIERCDAALARLRTQAGPIAQVHAAQVKELSARIIGIKDDIKGQISEAISKPEWYKKWGKHYLLSLQRAHLLMQCNNFKDPGIQHYGGALFRHYRDKADDVFMSLPPPTPSRAVHNPGVYGSGQSAPTPRINMAVYNDMSGGCLHETSIVHMSDGTRKLISDLSKGDYVATKLHEQNGAAEVVCIVRTKCAGGSAKLATLNSGLRITAWHPVRDSGKWTFPAAVCGNRPLKNIRCDYVYTFILREIGWANSAVNMQYAASLVADGTECIALGHGIENDPVASHPFFGTSCVVEALQKCQGWSEGLITLNQCDYTRDPVTGKINGLFSS